MIENALSIIREAAEAGGKIVKSYFGNSLEITEKSGVADVLTKADLESEGAILSILEKAFPEYNIFSEERGRTDKKSEYTFIVDPLDGTNNFVLGIPQVSIGIVLMKGETIVASVVHNPIVSASYYALSGGGSFLNGEKIQVNKESRMDRATISVSCPYSTTSSEKAAMAGKVYSLSPKRMTLQWSPLLDYCYLASGKTEALITDIPNLYDFLPGKLIVREAGAKITDFEGKESTDMAHLFVASNGTGIHESVLGILKK